MRVTRNLGSELPFVMTQEDLQKLFDALCEAFDQVTAQASCEDGLTRHFTNPADVLAYENLPTRAIRRLTLRGSIREPPFSGATLSFDAHGAPSVHVDIDADEAVATELDRALQDRLLAMRPWYSRLATLPIFPAIWWLQGLAILGGFLYILFVVLLGGARITLDRHKEVPPTLFVVWVVLGFLPVAGWLMEKAQKRLFPVATFALGHGIRHHEFREKVRWTVVAGFVVSFVASLLVARC